MGNPASGKCLSKCPSGRAAYPALSLARELRGGKMSFPPSCAFFISFFLRNYGKILRRWHFTLLLKYMKLFFYSNSVGSFPVDNDIPSLLRSAHVRTCRTISSHETKRKGWEPHTVWGNSALPLCKCIKASTQETSVLCKVFDLLNLSKGFQYLI